MCPNLGTFLCEAVVGEERGHCDVTATVTAADTVCPRRCRPTVQARGCGCRQLGPCQACHPRTAWLSGALTKEACGAAAHGDAGTGDASCLLSPHKPATQWLNANWDPGCPCRLDKNQGLGFTFKYLGRPCYAKIDEILGRKNVSGQNAFPSFHPQPSASAAGLSPKSPCGSRGYGLSEGGLRLSAIAVTEPLPFPSRTRVSSPQGGAVAPSHGH